MRNTLLAAALCLAGVARADLTLVNEINTAGKPPRTVTLSVKGALALFELDEGAGTRTMLRDGNAKKMYAINHEKKELVVITEADSREMEARQAQFRAQMQAQLDKLPPEKRARMEATMLGPAPTAKPASYTFDKKKTPARKVAGFTCQDYTVKRDGVDDGEGCFTPWKDIGVTAKVFKESLEQAMPSAATQGMLAHAFDEHASAPGFPVYRVRNGRDGAKTEATVKSFTKTALGDEKFVLPKGYTERSVGDAMKAPPPPRPAK